MQRTTDREWPRWYIEAERIGLTLEEIAYLTGRSYSAVYRYATGTRGTPADWLVKVELLIRSRQPRIEFPGGDAA